MPNTNLNIAVDEAREHVVVGLDKDGKSAGRVALDAAEAERHAHLLARQRAELAERVAETLDESARIEALFDPLWRTSPQDDGPTLLVRHPGLGWLGFIFPPAEARAIGQSLIKLAEAADTRAAARTAKDS